MIQLSSSDEQQVSSNIRRGSRERKRKFIYSSAEYIFGEEMDVSLSLRKRSSTSGKDLVEEAKGVNSDRQTRRQSFEQNKAEKGRMVEVVVKTAEPVSAGNNKRNEKKTNESSASMNARFSRLVSKYMKPKSELNRTKKEKGIEKKTNEIIDKENEKGTKDCFNKTSFPIIPKSALATPNSARNRDSTRRVSFAPDVCGCDSGSDDESDLNLGLRNLKNHNTANYSADFPTPPLDEDENGVFPTSENQQLLGCRLSLPTIPILNIKHEKRSPIITHSDLGVSAADKNRAVEIKRLAKAEKRKSAQKREDEKREKRKSMNYTETNTDSEHNRFQVLLRSFAKVMAEPPARIVTEHVSSSQTVTLPPPSQNRSALHEHAVLANLAHFAQTHQPAVQVTDRLTNPMPPSISGDAFIDIDSIVIDTSSKLQQNPNFSTCFPDLYPYRYYL